MGGCISSSGDTLPAQHIHVMGGGGGPQTRKPDARHRNDNEVDGDASVPSTHYIQANGAQHQEGSGLRAFFGFLRRGSHLALHPTQTPSSNRNAFVEAIGTQAAGVKSPTLSMDCMTDVVPLEEPQSCAQLRSSQKHPASRSTSTDALPTPQAFSPSVVRRLQSTDSHGSESKNPLLASNRSRDSLLPIPNAGSSGIVNPGMITAPPDFPSSSSTLSGAVQAPMVAPELADRLRPFQPSCLRSQILDYEKDCSQVEGAIAFVDISGFSALAHNLGQGSKGAMILSEYLNDYLTPLISLVQERHGDIVTFAGDAFLALWTTDATGETTKIAPLLCATQCALTMQERFNRYHVPGTNVVLKIHIGVAYGCFMGFAINSGIGRRLYLLAGRPMMAVGTAADLADGGQVCLTPDAQHMIREHLVGLSLTDGHFIPTAVRSPSGNQPSTCPCASIESPRQPRRHQVWSVPTHKMLEEYLPTVLSEHLHSVPIGLSATVALQRYVSVLFLGQSEMPYNDSDIVHQFVVSAMQIVIRNEGEVLQVLQDDKGLHLIAVFGITAATDTPAIPAVQSALEMLASPHINADIPCHIGIATGNVFCGIVGSEQRKAFDVLGDSVNLACRLMQLCADIHRSFACDEATASNCAGKFFFNRPTQMYPLKGQSAPTRICTVQESSEYEHLGLDVLRRRLQVHGVTVCARHQERALLDSAIRNTIARVRKTATMMNFNNNSASPHPIPPITSISSMASYNFQASPEPTPRRTTYQSETAFLQPQLHGDASSFIPPTPSSASFASTSTRHAGLRLCSLSTAKFMDGSGAILMNPVTTPMIVFEGHVGSGRTMLAVDMQNQWPLLPVVVASVSEYDRGAFSTFRYVVSALIAWIRLYSETCKITPGSDEEIIKQLLPEVRASQLAVLDSLLCTRFGAVSAAAGTSMESLPPTGGGGGGGTHLTVNDGARGFGQGMATNDSGGELPSVPNQNSFHSPSSSCCNQDDPAVDTSGSAVIPSQSSLDGMMLDNPISSGGLQSNVTSTSTERIGALLKSMIQNFCVRVPICVLCYDDAHFMDAQSQDLVDELHVWATETQPQPNLLQILFVESGSITVLPKGATRHELHDLTVNDIREFLYHALEEVSSAVESDIFPEDLCHMIGKKASYSPLMMAELNRVISSPKVLKGIQTDQRGEVRFSPKALTDVLEFDFSSSRKITMMVAHGFDCLDAPQQIIAKAASVILAHPEARLYRPQLYHLLHEFSPEDVDLHFDWLLARRLMVVDSSGQAIAEEWRGMKRYRFSLECFGSVLSALMSPNVLQNMNRKLGDLMLTLTLIESAVNYDVVAHYLHLGKANADAARLLILAIDTYGVEADEHHSVGGGASVRSSSPRTGARLRMVTGGSGGSNIGMAGAGSSPSRMHQTYATVLHVRKLVQRLKVLAVKLSNETKDKIQQCLLRYEQRASLSMSRLGNSFSSTSLLVQMPANRSASPTQNGPRDAAFANMETTGITDLDASARRLLVALGRVEQRLQLNKSQVSPLLWRQFTALLDGYQNIQKVVVSQQPSPDFGDRLHFTEINALIQRISNGSGYGDHQVSPQHHGPGAPPRAPATLDEDPEVTSPTENPVAAMMMSTPSSSSSLLDTTDPNSATTPSSSSLLLDLRRLRELLLSSATVAVQAAKSVLAIPITGLHFAWKDAYLIGISTIDLQHKQLFVIMRQLAEVAFAKMDPTARHSRLSKVLKWLLEYVLFHFLAEEVLMRRITYPQYPQHRCVHQTFTGKCLDIQAKFNEGALDVNGELLSSMYQWLVVHIGHSDHHFGSYFVSHRGLSSKTHPNNNAAVFDSDDLMLATTQSLMHE